MTKLGAKGYWEQFQPSPEFVVMFLPGEAIFQAALQKDAPADRLRRRRPGVPVEPADPDRAASRRGPRLAPGARHPQRRAGEPAGQGALRPRAHLTERMETLRGRLDGTVRAFNDTVATYEGRVLVTARQASASSARPPARTSARWRGGRRAALADRRPGVSGSQRHGDADARPRPSRRRPPERRSSSKRRRRTGQAPASTDCGGARRPAATSGPSGGPRALSCSRSPSSPAALAAPRRPCSPAPAAAPTPRQPRRPRPRAEATSLLGKPLDADGTGEPREARGQPRAAPRRSWPGSRSADALIWVGRRQGYLWRYRDAIATFTKGIARFPTTRASTVTAAIATSRSASSTRRIADFEKATQLIKGKPDEIEPDGAPNAAGKPRSTLQFNIWYHLGLAYYLKGDYTNATRAYDECMRVSTNDDPVTATSDWQWMTLMRLGRQGRRRPGARADHAEDGHPREPVVPQPAADVQGPREARGAARHDQRRRSHRSPRRATAWATTTS